VWKKNGGGLLKNCVLRDVDGRVSLQTLPSQDEKNSQFNMLNTLHCYHRHDVCYYNIRRVYRVQVRYTRNRTVYNIILDGGRRSVAGTQAVVTNSVRFCFVV